MKKYMRGLSFSILAFTMVMGLHTTAFAARPTAKPQFSSTQYISRGYTYNMKFYLKSGSYTAKRGYARARFDTDMFNSAGNRVAYTNYYGFTGKGYYTVSYKIGTNYVRRTWYRLRYRTQYRSSIYSSVWYTNTSKFIRFYIR